MLNHTKRLINDACVTVICFDDDCGILLNKLLSEMDGRTHSIVPKKSVQTAEEAICQYSISSTNFTVINLDNIKSTDSSGFSAKCKSKYLNYAESIAELANFAVNSKAHLLAICRSDKTAAWRSTYFYVPEIYKDKVVFMRLIRCQNEPRIKLTVETGNCAGRYLLYSLDGNDNLKETDI